VVFLCEVHWAAPARVVGASRGGVAGGSEMTFGLGWFDPVGPWYLLLREDAGSLMGLGCSGPARGGGFGFHSHP
jgi:hypothetical protein